MKAIRCVNGHWYDSELYDKCPHCGQANTKEQNNPTNTLKEKKGFSLFKNRKKIKEKKQTIVSNDNVSSESTVKESSVSTHDKVAEQFFSDIDDEKTIPMFFSFDDNSDSVAVETGTNPTEKQESINRRTESELLAAAVQRVSSMDDGKTLSYFNNMTNQTNLSEAEVIKNLSDPVVGWLVAIEGPHIGDSFQLYVGKNTIGRNDKNKVMLAMDRSVSRENHAFIIYEPKRRAFYLQSGDSDGLIYLNDSFINGSQIMNKNDVLEIGSSKLIFIPLCGKDFSWEHYM